MDYDSTAMPSAYDAGRAYAPEVLDFWLRTISAPIALDLIKRILDLGCGTGRYSAALAAHFNAHVIAVDPSEKMLSEARKKESERVRFVRGSAEAVPLAGGAVDMVFMSMVFHHFANPERAARECHRVLRARGVVSLRAGASDRSDDYPYVPFFPRTRSLIRSNLQSLLFMQKTFTDADFELAHHEVVQSAVASSWSEYAEKIAHRADSILVQLTDVEFADGLAGLRAHALTAPAAERVIEPVDFFVFRRG